MVFRFALSALVLVLLTPVALAADSVGDLRAGADGRPLNLDFETGTLKDWTVEGKAFEGQPIKGDTVIARGRGMKSGHQGDFWIGGYEKLEDNQVGTLTSAPFKVTKRWASFMFAGGHWEETRVELLTAADNKVFFKVSGDDHETLRPVLVDLSAQAGKEIKIRLVDQRKGAWGHLNFDNFRVYDTKPELKQPAIANVPAPKGPPPGPADQFKYAGLSADDAAKAFTLPPGFKASVIASEPEIINPIAFTIDARGRIWVVQALTYPKKAPDGQGKDSIFIFEDQGDGRRWKKSVFMEGLNLVSGIEVGFGGVWIGAVPELLFIPYKDENGVTKPSGPPQVLLDGWGMQDTHETLNSFTWGPDGWLYGCHGVFTQSYVGKPGTPKEQRVHINAGVWRYHPTKHIFERFAEGTSNPWGLDFDEHGQMFIEGCVIPHLWHIIQNARYQRQGGQHDNPYTFDDIKQVGDHVHYLGNTPHGGNGRFDTAGGGHAHSGLMVYLGDNWPDEYRGKIFMNNIHGAGINMDIPEPQGSGFVGKHGKDFLLANDKASQILAMKYGPDGSVYIIDWYDLQQCHTNKPTDHDRTTGRIFRVSYGDVKPVKVDLEKMTDVELVKLQEHKNEWYPRMARKVLAERAALHPIGLEVIGQTSRLVSEQNPLFTLRALWTAHAMGAYEKGHPEGELHPKIGNAIAAHDVWAIQIACETQNLDTGDYNRMLRVARESKSPESRLALSSALSRLPTEKRWNVLEALLAHSEDASDHNLPLMYWYALEPLLDVDANRALELATNTKIPNILSFSVRKLATIGGQNELDALVARLDKTDSESAKLEILRGMTAGLKGRRGVPAPAGWEDASKKLASSPQGEIAILAKGLAVIFGSKSAMADLKAKALDRSAAAGDRIAAIESLVTAKDASLAAALQQLLDDQAVRGAAIRGLAAFDDPNTSAAILGKYGSFSATEKKDALLTLAGRPAYAKALLSAVGPTLPAIDFTADVLRQLRNLKNEEVDALIGKHWAAARETEKDKLDKIKKLKGMIGNAPVGVVDPGISVTHGRALFAKTCAQCHTLFGDGGKVGPDITGSDRANLDYLLTNVIDPNALIPADYLAWDCTTTDDRSITGILKKQDDRTVVLQTANETVTLARSEVKSLKASKLSMMPEGLIDNMPENDIKDLVAYLRSPARVALLADADSAKTLFNGKDLTGWEAIEDGLYSVENGEIVGRTKTGIKKNQFLTSKLAVKDFRLIVKIKLTPDAANSGIQFRSVRLPGSTEMHGCQADAGQGWWGKLYEESGRALLFPKKGQEFDGGKFVNKEDWNTYEVLAVGGKIRTAINRHVCTDIDDDQVAKEGIFGLQIHSGGPTEVHFKDFELELDPKFELKTVK